MNIFDLFHLSSFRKKFTAYQTLMDIWFYLKEKITNYFIWLLSC